MNTTTSTAERSTNNTRTAAPRAIPAATIRQRDDGTYLLVVEMPGVTKSGVGVSVEGNELTVSGSRTYPDIKGNVLHREIRTSDFQRVFELDASIDTARIQARIDNGILRVELPIAEAVKPRRIQVEA